MAQINKPSDYFNTKLYTGTGASQSITGVGFQPDWVWIKGRSIAYDNNLFDAVRGTEKRIKANATSAEDTVSGSVTAFGTDGFTVGADAGVNANTETFVSWNWLGANGTASNTDGSITSTVSANTTSGFSIVSYTGTGANATVGHGLGAVPKMIIFKNRDDVNNWLVYHDGIGNTKALELDTTSSTLTGSSFFNNTTPTSSVFTVNTDGKVNASTKNLIAYCFAEKKGFSKFGSYTGNGSTDGTFVYTGFKPAFVLSKCTSHAGENWNINDSKRPGSNVIQNALLPDSSAAEVTASFQALDILSNGFKWRGTNDRVNASGKTYIYMAFAESPLVGTNNTPATAR